MTGTPQSSPDAAAPLQLQIERLKADFELEKQKITTRGHIVGAGLGVASSIIVALIGVTVNNGSSSETSKPITNPKAVLAASLNPDSILFSHEYVPSAELWNREKWDRDEKWEERCLTVAREILYNENYKIAQLKINAARGELDGTHIGIRCDSDQGHALVFGLADASDDAKLVMRTDEIKRLMHNALNAKK